MTTPEPTPKEIAAKPAVTGATIAGRLCGAVGSVLLASTLLTFLLTETVGVLVVGKLVLGGALVGTYLFTNADFWSRLSGSRSAGLTLITVLTSALFIGLVGVANYLVVKHDKEIDVTREGIYTLSDQTVQILSHLKTDVKAIAFYASHEEEFLPVKETLERYAKAGGRFTFEMIDPQLREDLVTKYMITSRGPRIVISARDQEARVKELSEEELTHAVIKVAEENTKRIYFLTGHGEADLDDDKGAEGYKSIADAVRAEGYEVDTLSLLALGGEQAAKDTKVSLKAPHGDAHDDDAGGLEIPAKVSALIIPRPKTPLSAPELKGLEDYLARGGRIVVLLEPNQTSGLEGLLRQWKIEVEDDIIVDTNVLNRLVGLGPASPMVVPTDDEHAITKTMGAPAIFATARSLAVNAGGTPGVETKALLQTSDSAWGETNTKSDTAERDDRDHAGPLKVAVVATKAIPATAATRMSDEARLVVFGDSDFVNNGLQTKPGNADLFLNTINWLAEQTEKISIRPKTRPQSQLFLSVNQLGTLKFFSMDILPVLLVAMGLGVVMLRRQR
ncbi:MAG: Gldg family protein [Deltaproteobacteria bacterium]|nr:Gldg family protein [Deltaproteobacteria bacterium]